MERWPTQSSVERRAGRSLSWGSETDLRNNERYGENIRRQGPHRQRDLNPQQGAFSLNMVGRRKGLWILNSKIKIHGIAQL